MKAISILGTSSNAGKSWLATAFCALMRRKGVKVAPFKAQNMSNNSYVTLEGGEIGRAQAVQAEACGLRPIAEMNPVLLKPSGDSISQVIQLGRPGPHVKAGSFYKDIEAYRDLVRSTLDWWKPRCELLILEGAGSPVELNLMDRDVVNLFPVNYLDGKWILAADIERGGVFAQAIGTVQLMPAEAQARGLGLVVNKFRGDLGLFADAQQYFARHIQTPYLGVLPMRYDLQPETEDGFALESGSPSSTAEPFIAWIRFPRISNSQDMQPWSLDQGVTQRWVTQPRELESAAAIVLPGSKNTIADLQWLKNVGLAEVICQKASQGIPVVGICGGYQMLGIRLVDPEGRAGLAGEVDGLSLLPVETVFESEKQVVQVNARWQGKTWGCYEIHMGVTRAVEPVQPLLSIELKGNIRPEGLRAGKVWGTYLHGFFEEPDVRRSLADLAGIPTHRASNVPWEAHKQSLYGKMADLLEAHLELDAVYHHVGL
jgi:adenosylcobyric acid synthase